MTTKTLGEAIRELREKADLSLRELAKKLEVSAPFLSDVELGRRYPSDDVLAKLAKHLQVATDVLKQYDHRSSVTDFKRILESNPRLGFAFRTAIEELKQGRLSPEQLADQLRGKKR